MTSSSETDQPIDQPTAEQISECNATGRTPVVFIHGLWLLPSSWDRWAERLRGGRLHAAHARAGPTTPRPSTRRTRIPRSSPTRPSAQVADHYDDVIGKLDRKPAVVGHSFGGLLAQILAGRGLSPSRSRSTRRRSAACCRCRSRRCGRPRRCWRNPANRNRAVPLTYEQFRYAFANAVSEDEAKRAVRDVRRAGARRAAVPGGDGQPQPVDRGEGRQQEPRAGAAAIISGEKDHTVPWAIANARSRSRSATEAVTEIVEIPGRGHSLTIDSGWREVADTALALRSQRHAQ